jgi:hypothetical protein
VIRGSAHVEYADGTTDELHVVPFDWVRYERYCASRKVTADIREGPATWGMYLAYSAYERAHAGNGAGPVPGFDVWAATIEQLDLNLETPDPTPTAAPAE